MPNSYYNHGTVPATNAPGASAPMRAEFDAITAGFALLPTLAANANKIVAVNAGATALTVITQLDGFPIGQVTPAAGSFTTLSATGATTLAALTSTGINSSPVGATTPSTGAFTTLSATGATTLAALTATGINSSPIGQTTPAAGKFTTLVATGATTLAALSATSIDTSPIGQTTPAAGKFTTLVVTGATTATTAAPGDNSTTIATTSFVATSFLTSATAASTYAPIASPTFTGTVTGPGYTVTGATVPANGMYLVAANNLALSTSSTEAVRISSTQQVGIGSGATLSAWGANFRSLVLGSRGAGFWGRTDSNQLGLAENAFFDGANFKYVQTAAATIGTLLGGAFTISNAASGTAGTSITFVNRFAVSGLSSTHSTQLADSAGTLLNAGYLEVPQNLQNANYTTVLSDSSKHIGHTSGSAHTHTIDSNANVAYPIGTTLTFWNGNAAGNVTIAITTDTMRIAGAGTTGSRTLTANGRAVALKVAATEWQISGTNLT